jgi:hypothetical protein
MQTLNQLQRPIMSKETLRGSEVAAIQEKSQGIA